MAMAMHNFLHLWDARFPYITPASKCNAATIFSRSTTLGRHSQKSTSLTLA